MCGTLGTGVTVRNVTCYTPISITHGGGGTSDVLVENCTVHGDWGADTTYRPQWWKTALRIKTDRNTNGTVANVVYRNVRAVGVDLLFDIQSWCEYICTKASDVCFVCVCVGNQSHSKGFILRTAAALGTR